MSIPIKRKAEEAFCNLIQGLIPGEANPLTGVPVVPGHRGEARTLPVVVCYAAQARERDEMVGSGIYDVELKIFILTQADKETVSDQDARLQAVQDMLRQSDIRAALNCSTGTEPDTRAVQDFHVWGFYENSQDEGREGRHYGDVLTYIVVCQGADGSLQNGSR